MNCTSLVFGLGEYFSHSSSIKKTLISYHQFYAIQATASKPLKEANPAGFAFLHALGGI